MAVVCAWIRGVLARLSGTAETLSGSEARQAGPPRASNMTWFEGFDSIDLAVAGSRVRARAGGPPDAPALLLLHGFPQTHAMWHRVACALAPVGALVFGDSRLAIFAAGLAALITWRHRPNIQRLLAGTEPRFGSKKN